MQARVLEVDLVPLFPVEIAEHRVIGTIWLSFQASYSRVKFGQAFCGRRRAGLERLGPVGGQFEARRHRTAYQLVAEKSRHHAQVPGKCHREPVDRGVESRSEVAKDLARRPVAERL